MSARSNDRCSNDYGCKPNPLPGLHSPIPYRQIQSSTYPGSTRFRNMNACVGTVTAYLGLGRVQVNASFSLRVTASGSS